jgi:hypothetical protein
LSGRRHTVLAWSYQETLRYCLPKRRAASATPPSRYPRGAEWRRLEDLLGADKAVEAQSTLLLPNIELRLRDTIRVGETDARIMGPDSRDREEGDDSEEGNYLDAHSATYALSVCL